MKKSILIYLLLLVLTLMSCTNSYQVSKGIPIAVENTMKDAVKNKHRIGISLAFVNEQGIHYSSCGNSQISGANQISDESVFGVGSLSKIFTALVFADMVANSEIKLQTPVNEYLPPSYQVPSSQNDTMRLEHLVTHTSGLPKNLPVIDSNNSLYKAVSEFSYSFNYGDTYIYSNIGMALLGNILEIESGKKLDQLVAERITSPLQMHQTTYDLNKAMNFGLVTGHLEAKPIIEESKENLSLGFVYGGLYASTKDLSKLISVYLTDSSTVLFSTLKLTQQKYEETDIGFGWKIKNFEDVDIFYHGGEQPGYQSFLGFNKEQGIGVVLMVNSTSQDNIQDIAIHLLTNGEVPLPDFSFPKEVEITPEYLNRYVGIYKSIDSPEENTFDISIQNAKLFCVERSSKGNLIRESILYAKNETEFYFKEIPLVAKFKTDNDSGNTMLILVLEDKGIIFEGGR